MIRLGHYMRPGTTLRTHRRPLRVCCARFHFADRLRGSSRRGEALWEREAAESDSLGAASSESAAGAFGSGAAAVESAADSVVALSCGWVWMVVRFVCVIRVPVCPCVPCVSRLPPVSFYRRECGGRCVCACQREVRLGCVRGWLFCVWLCA